MAVADILRVALTREVEVTVKAEYRGTIEVPLGTDVTELEFNVRQSIECTQDDVEGSIDLWETEVDE